MPFSFSGLFQAKSREPEPVASASKTAEPVVSASEAKQPQQQHRAKTSSRRMDQREFFTDYGEANRYSIKEVIGKGSYGLVCSAIDNYTGEKVAIKKINNVFEHVSDATRILREIKLLRLLKHPDIVEIKHIMLPPSPRDFKDIYVVFELMETDLHQVRTLQRRVAGKQHKSQQQGVGAYLNLSTPMVLHCGQHARGTNTAFATASSCSSCELLCAVTGWLPSCQQHMELCHAWLYFCSFCTVCHCLQKQPVNFCCGRAVASLQEQQLQQADHQN
eukprot:GHRQ01013731.1.p1 GENE.GHRQ01013731.1~~GHRQ01013731.1.p1  ORF type:complete len:275 (+),score=61.96 GHRQ01013731.1:192-1016(+)